VALARQQLTDTAVVAPLDGIIQEKRASTGEYLAAGAPVVNIVRMDPLRLRAEIPERESHTVRPGQSVRVTVEGDTTIYVGQIMRLSPVIAEQTRILMVEADVRNNGKLRPGSFAHAEIVTNDAKMAVTVRITQLSPLLELKKFWWCRTARRSRNRSRPAVAIARSQEIVAGVNVGEKVILEPGNLQTGQDVQVLIRRAWLSF
jgi:RND family efflux transporter MFP subunit